VIEEGLRWGESRRRTWSMKEEGSKCVKIYEHFFFLDAIDENYSL